MKQQYDLDTKVTYIHSCWPICTYNLYTFTTVTTSTSSCTSSSTSISTNMNTVTLTMLLSKY